MLWVNLNFSPMSHRQKTLVVIAGPTAVGKTATAIAVARHLGAEIISADSRQFYREMSIGTAKPTPAELAAAPHHFINSHSVTDNFSVGDFERQALQVLDTLFSRSPYAVLAGGSGLFVRAVCDGFDDLPTANEQAREKWNTAFAQHGITYLQQALQQADAAYYAQVDVNNHKRLIRALEAIDTTGMPFSAMRTATKKQRNFNIIKIGLNLPRQVLYNRINQRVDQMLADGLLAEAEAMLPYRHLNALQTVGYTELFAYFDGKLTLQQATDLIKQNTRRFAKRQLTWFGREADMHWFEPQQLNLVLQCIEQYTGAI